MNIGNKSKEFQIREDRRLDFTFATMLSFFISHC